MERLSGILLHPTSLPSRYGIGDLGTNAFEFVDYLRDSGQKLWQILPLGPPGYGESPYSPFSSLAGNILLIDLENLLLLDLIDTDDLINAPIFAEDRVDFMAVKEWKLPLLNKAAANFSAIAGGGLKDEYKQFCDANSYWLEDYALFESVREHYGYQSWNLAWDKSIMRKESDAVKKWSDKLQSKILQNKILQFFFYKQWITLKNYANKHGIKIIGDIPIFVSGDSSDVWSHNDLFLLDKDCQPTSVAGVPPDYFSKTGQRWGNPLYDWKKMEENNFKWWIERIKTMQNYVDIVRIDHFRGLRAFWKIPASEETAVNGKWTKAPGEKLFKAIKEALGDIEILAEDLGTITKDVHALRKKLKLPGMKILHFAFEFDKKGIFNPKNSFLPHNYEENTIAYTGTHDNNTTLGWYKSLDDKVQDIVRRYYGISGDDISWDLIRSILSSRANYVIIPMQDILSLDEEHRMNLPSTVGNNWDWRLKSIESANLTSNRLKELTEIYNR